MSTARKPHCALQGQEITAVILAGGQARRMGGQDKGLLELAGRPMIEHIITALAPQASGLLINANRNLERYRDYGVPVIPDLMGEYFGPLAGMASGMRAAKTRYLLTAPCDSPFVPAGLAAILHGALQAKRAEICAAHDGQRIQPVFALLRCDLLPDLLAYLEQGGRKIDTWYARHRLALADFSRWPDAFLNINTPQDRRVVEHRLQHPSPVAPAS
jgi:molybdenum cofactor guanylyltransferase